MGAFDESLVEHYITTVEGNSTVIDADKLVEDDPDTGWAATQRTLGPRTPRLADPIPGVERLRGAPKGEKPGDDLGDRRCPDARLVLPEDVDHNDPRWDAERTKGYGGSDAAKIMGDSSYGGIATVYDEKTDAAPVSFTGSHYTAVGHAVEPLIAEEFEAKTGIRTRRAGTMAARSRDYFRANVDRLTADGGVLEIKSFRNHSKVAEDWEAGPSRKPPGGSSSSAWPSLVASMATALE